jgi:hypothetical protein
MRSDDGIVDEVRRIRRGMKEVLSPHFPERTKDYH